ncbi:glycerol-3-phosphate dehydrogenase [Aureimonas fodinaquatilis]|uniref:Glycerol-3-phosphate dehydrogenase n=1 Tax=Aureimonas fodinaquatilis TaxID=2565783 RepID=A0A5B0DVQ3_9HYPH|nr:glycerol-3-phosphate dehydrogenase [Aureimonas fodinaquatilis]KAA0970428.1 glycerol-3-phosphate dehydrogenase [Aureimonas fodinaquatilis]
MTVPGSFDIFIIGGGVNGCGIARDAAGRGFSVGLAEMNDLASGTSSWSTKLVHGGLRYLEHYEFRLVREALIEREVLWRMAPHIIHPLRFILPHHKELRPAWMLRLGLLLYDNLGGRKNLPATRTIDLSGPLGAPLDPQFRTGFEYSDARVDDSRLVVLNARDAVAHGAQIFTRTRVVGCHAVGGKWEIDLMEPGGLGARTVHARAIVNAAGPWTDEAVATRGHSSVHNVRLVKGSHLVVRKLYDHDRAYIFQNRDGRIIFTIPFERDYTLIGTTDLDYTGDPAQAAITPQETDYLLAAAGEYLKTPVPRDAIVWAYSGVRPLYDDHASKAQEATRDYVLKMSREDGAPVLDIFGGKITTYRRLAEDSLQHLEHALGKKGKSWTASAPLPGGNFQPEDADALLKQLQRLAPDVAADVVERLFWSYGTLAREILQTPGGMGQEIGHGLYEAEVRWLVENEWARTAEDILVRRSKLVLRFTEEETAALSRYLTTLTDPLPTVSSP